MLGLRYKFQIVLVFLLCCTSVPAHTSGYIDGRFTPQQLIEDVDFYVKTLEETHINPFIYVTEKEWRAHVDKIKSQITEQRAMTREQFWLLLAPLVSSIQDGHTVIVEPRFLLRNNTTKYLPIHTASVNGKVVVTSSVADVPIARGTVITSINGIDSDDVVYKLSRYAYGSEKNDNFGADAMASQLAHLLNVIVTSPMGNEGEFGGWCDRYGFENAAKCFGTFGQTYLAPNGGTANIQLGTRHFLIQQNWVNGRKGFCAMAAPQP